MRPGPESPTPDMPGPAVLIAIALPVLLAVVLAAVAIGSRLGIGPGAAPTPDTAPLAVVPVDAPAASDPACSALLAVLPVALPAEGGPLPSRPLVDPAPAGVRAWAATPGPALLRCGLPRPAELTPSSALLEVNGVRWLALAAAPEMLAYVAVDRSVYVALVCPATAGSGPIQVVSDSIRSVLPATAVAVR